jgi:hypothetical protein
VQYNRERREGRNQSWSENVAEEHRWVFEARGSLASRRFNFVLNGCQPLGKAIYGRDKPIPASRHSFYEPWTLGGVAKYVANLVDRSVEVTFEINEGVGPYSFL